MKTIFLLLAILFSLPVFAQKRRGPVHGQIFGSRPDTTGVMDASKIEEFMAKKARVSVAIRGKILRVIKEKGGWFTIDGGRGRIIGAHFKNYDVTIPRSLAGRTVILDGVAAKQFIADDQQHFAGDTVTGKKQSKVKTNPKRKITFEVSGLVVDK